jgi:hypothetical protein
MIYTSRTCIKCGEPFTAPQKTLQYYCSDRCRKGRHNLKKIGRSVVKISTTKDSKVGKGWEMTLERIVYYLIEIPLVGILIVIFWAMFIGTIQYFFGKPDTTKDSKVGGGKDEH